MKSNQVARVRVCHTFSNAVATNPIGHQALPLTHVQIQFVQGTRMGTMNIWINDDNLRAVGECTFQGYTPSDGMFYTQGPDNQLGVNRILELANL